MRVFFGETFISKELLDEAGIGNKIKLDYYKIINEDEITRKEKSKYGISVIKTEYMRDKTKIEEKIIKHLSNDEKMIEGVLNLFKENVVTPIEVKDIINDIFHQFIYAL